MARTQLLGPERIDIDDSLTRRDVQRLAADPALKVVQTAVPVRTKTWALLDEYLFAVRPDVQLRVYGQYRHECDLGITKHVPHVRDFAADSLRRASNIEAIAELPELHALSLGIYELDSFAVLNNVPRELHSLSLGALGRRSRISRHSLDSIQYERSTSSDTPRTSMCSVS